MAVRKISSALFAVFITSAVLAQPATDQAINQVLAPESVTVINNPSPDQIAAALGVRDTRTELPITSISQVQIRPWMRQMEASMVTIGGCLEQRRQSPECDSAFSVLLGQFTSTQHVSRAAHMSGRPWIAYSEAVMTLRAQYNALDSRPWPAFVAVMRECSECHTRFTIKD